MLASVILCLHSKWNSAISSERFGITESVPSQPVSDFLYNGDLKHHLCIAAFKEDSVNSVFANLFLQLFPWSCFFFHRSDCFLHRLESSAIHNAVHSLEKTIFLHSPRQC